MFLSPFGPQTDRPPRSLVVIIISVVNISVHFYYDDCNNFCVRVAVVLIQRTITPSSLCTVRANSGIEEFTCDFNEGPVAPLWKTNKLYWAAVLCLLFLQCSSRVCSCTSRLQRQQKERMAKNGDKGKVGNVLSMKMFYG